MIGNDAELTLEIDAVFLAGQWDIGGGGEELVR